MDVRGYIHQNKTESVRNLGAVDISRLKARALALSESDWDQHNAAKPNTFNAFGTTRHVVFRFVHRLTRAVESYALPAWDEWSEDVEPLLAHVTKLADYEQAGFPRVMLANVPPGGAIAPHRDGGKYPSFCHKIHIPLSTNPKAGFYVEPDWYHLEEGHAYEVNNNALHTVRNQGDQNRIHLVLELFKTPLQLTEHQLVTKPPETATA